MHVLCSVFNLSTLWRKKQGIPFEFVETQSIHQMRPLHWIFLNRGQILIWSETFSMQALHFNSKLIKSNWFDGCELRHKFFIIAMNEALAPATRYSFYATMSTLWRAIYFSGFQLAFGLFEALRCSCSYLKVK